MIVRVRVNDNLWIEDNNPSTETDTFKTIARLTEVFTHQKCGRCGSADVKFVCRQDKDENDWLEIVCQNSTCRARLVFGQKKGKGGEIYPKVRWNNLSETQQKERADEEEYAADHYGWLPNGGWYIYKYKPKDENAD